MMVPSFITSVPGLTKIQQVVQKLREHGQARLLIRALHEEFFSLRFLLGSEG
jgi:hypothetical protein